MSYERDGHFIFREAEFEVDDFSGASFVARHRRVSSLEALREQLRGYCESLKKELYGIINRDYRDFIAIATKLDGVDLRVDHLRKPLLDLRIDLEVLRDNLVASTSAIQDKLRARSEISIKKKLIENSLIAMTELDVIETIIEQPIEKSDELENDNNSKKLSRRDLLQKISKINGISNVISIDEKVFYSSELERAAYSLSRAQECIQIIKTSNLSSNLSNSNQLLSSSSSSSSGLSKTLEQRIQRLKDILIQRLRSKIVTIFSNSASSLTGSIENADSNMEAEASRIQKLFSNRAFTHCIRALIVLSRGDVAEEVVATTVVEPYVKSTITHGRADGSGGRGSYSGLKECLENLVNMLRATLQPALESSEMIRSSFAMKDSTFDLVVCGIWMPVTSLLSDRFPGIFNSGIANTFSKCYNAVENFTKILATVAGPKYTKIITDRLSNHPLLKEFHEKWKLELYFHLRSQEISRRLDKACSTVSQQFLTVNTFDIIYSEDSNTTITTTVGLQQENVTTVSTLSIAQIEELKSNLNIKPFHLPLITCFAIEMSTCLHNTVLLQALGGKFFSFAMKIIYRLEAQIVFMLDINVDNSLVDDQQLKTKTPVKRNPSAIMSPHPSTPANEVTTETNCSIEELVLLTADLHNLIEWLEKSFSSYAEESLGYSNKMDGIIVKCINIVNKRIEITRDAVWNKVCLLLSTECKKSLVAVKAIAGKYRMTNKPPPESASPYVENIVLPLRSFLAQHKALIQPFASHGQWSIHLLEDIASSFLIQVQSLLETVKQMDNALQRRSKIRTAGGNTNTTMTDSDKIALQVSLDVKAFGLELKSLGAEPDNSKPYLELLEAVKMLTENK